MLKTRKFICQILMIALILGMTTPVFAADSDGNSNRETATITMEFIRESNTSATSITSAGLFGIATYTTGTLTLQEFKNGAWVKATGVSPVVQTETVYGTASIYMYNSWNLTKGKNYRLKFVCADKTDGITFAQTAYSNSI